MSIVDQFIQDHFDFSDFTTSQPLPGQVSGTQGEKDVILDALRLIYSDDVFRDLCAPTGMGADLSGRTDVLKVAMSTTVDNAFYASTSQAFDNNPQHVTGNNFIGFGAGLFSGLDIRSNGGAISNDQFSLVVAHEIIHSLITPSPYAGEYREESTVFLTNYFKNRIFGQFDNRVGHMVAADDLSSASSTTYLSGFDLISIPLALSNSEDQSFLFTDVFDNSITKTYYGAGQNGVDHLITISGQSADGSILFDDFSIEGTYVDIIDNSLVADENFKLQLLKQTKDALETYFGTLDTLSAGNSSEIYGLAKAHAAMPSFTASGLLTVSGERFLDAFPGGGTLDVVGPVSAGASTNSTANSSIDITISAQSAVSSIIFGASGIAASRVTNGSPINLDEATDKIRGSEKNDVIFLGDGIDSQGGRVNVAEGRGGLDILVGALSSSAKGVLIGGFNPSTNSTDIFISGAGKDIIVGNYNSTVSYAASAQGVTIDRTTFADVTFAGIDGTSYTKSANFGVGGDANGDSYIGIRTFIGSQSSANTFRGTSTSDYSYFIGGAGADTFYLKAGDVAFGGAGADKFYLSTSTNGVAYILDIGADDQIYVDGQLYTGRTMELERVPHVMNGHTYYTHAVVRDESAWGPVHGSNNTFDDATREDRMWRGKNDDGTLDGVAMIKFEDSLAHKGTTLYLGGWQEGDAGISMNLQYPIYGQDGVASIGSSNGLEFFNRYLSHGWDAFNAIPMY